jgi:serine/threonine-protein kinase
MRFLGGIMNIPPDRSDTPWPASLALRVEEICTRFEAAWQQGQRPRIEDYLGQRPEPEHSILLRELLALELAYVSKLGQTPAPQEYCLRFPQHAGLIHSVFQAENSSQQEITTDEKAPSLLHSPDPGLPQDRYRLERELGQGGMGLVYLGRDRRLDRPVAVKVLRKQHCGQPDHERRFREEAQVTGQLQHPGIPPVHEVGTLPDGRLFFAMKLIQGQTLAQLLRQRSSPAEDLPRFLAIFDQVSQTLAYARSQGVIHRDLKPGNVMVGAFGEVQVMDWGLAKVLQRPRADTDLYAGPEEAEADGSGEPESWEPLTQPGQVLGTPAYMPPEQARGELERVDERADVFGLGAMLCEILTGGPPFRGRNREEVFRRAQACDHTEALDRLEHCGADAELVQLARACLAPQPEDRPAEAGVVARTMAAYQAGVQQRLRAAEMERAAAQARAEEASAKVAAERRARRRLLGLAAAVLLLVVAGGGAGVWWWWQRSEQGRAVRGDLNQAAEFLRGGKGTEARTMLKRAEGRVGGGAPADLRGEVQQLREYLNIVDDLDHPRRLTGIGTRIQWHVTLPGRTFDDPSGDRKYAEVFHQYDLAEPGEDAERVARRFRDLPIEGQLVAALDDWALVTKNEDRRRWLLEVARRVQPGEWSDRFRDPKVWSDRKALERLAREARQALERLAARQARVTELSPQLLTTLGEALRRCGGDPVPLWKAAVVWHPADYWLHCLLGYTLLGDKPQEAIPHHHAALALRPEQAYHYTSIGWALHRLGKEEEAIQHYRRAIQVDPREGTAHYNLGNSCYRKGQVEEAMKHYLEAVTIDPEFSHAHYGLGVVLYARGKVEEAMQHWRQAIRLDHTYFQAHTALGAALKARGQVDEAIKHYRQAIQINPRDFIAYYNLGATLHARGQVKEAIGHFRKAILLDPKHAHAHGALGQALLRQGQFAQAREATRRCLDLLPPGHPLRKTVTQQLQECQRLLDRQDKLPKK